MRILIHQRPTPGAYVRLLLNLSRRLQHTLAWGADLENWQHIQTIGKEICSLPDVIASVVAVCGVD